MTTDLHTPWVDGVTVFSAADMNGPLAELDAAINALRSAIVSTSGAISWSEGTLTLAWDAMITVAFNGGDGKLYTNTVAAGSVVLADGEAAILDLVEVDASAISVSTVTITGDAASLLLAKNRMILGYCGGTTFWPTYLRPGLTDPPPVTFAGLTDTPADYSGQAGKLVKVNGTEDGLEFGVEPAGDFAGLSDTPANYTGATGKALVVKGTEDGVEFVPFPSVMDAYKLPFLADYPEADYVANVSTSAYCYKGNTVTPNEEVTLYGIACLLDSTVDSAAYKAMVAPISTATLGDVVTSAAFNNVGAERKWVWAWFDTPVVLTAGTQYAVGFGRVDGLGTDILSTHWPTMVMQPSLPLTQNDGWRMADVNPANGESVNLVADTTVPFVYAWSARGIPSITPKPYVQAVTYSASISINLGQGDIADLTLTGSPTIDLAGGEDGQVLTLRLRQDATGGRTVTWGSSVRFSTDVPAPTLSTGASKLDYLAFRYNDADAKYDLIAVNLGF